MGSRLADMPFGTATTFKNAAKTNYQYKYKVFESINEGMPEHLLQIFRKNNKNV
jgi:hypothetical protein